MELDPPQEASVPPGPPSAAPPPTPHQEGSAFIQALKGVGLLKELNEGLHAALMERLPSVDDVDVRRMELLRLYYLEAPKDGGHARRSADRFLLHDSEQPESARELVARIAELTPELHPVSLERIGTDDGPLVIRSGPETFSAVNEAEEDLDTDEIDLSELEAAPTVAVRALFRAFNILLDRIENRDRFVLLCSDGTRECYARLSLGDALSLCAAGHLDDEDDEEVLDLGAWGRG